MAKRYDRSDESWDLVTDLFIESRPAGARESIIT